MPPLHVLAAALPGIAYIAFASRGSWLRGKGVRGLSWRQLMLAWGLAIAVGAMSAAFVNSIAGLGVTVLLLVHNGAFEGVSSITSSGFFSNYTVWDVIADAEFLLTSNEQWVANIIAIAVVPPLGEEFLKGLSVRLPDAAQHARGRRRSRWGRRRGRGSGSWRRCCTGRASSRMT